MPDADMQSVLEVDLGRKLGQCRAVPVSLGPDAPKAFLAIFCADVVIDPYIEMFFFPTDTLKFALFTGKGEIIWTKDLGPGVVPGGWFCPVLAFDLDGDGIEEIWYVNNVNTEHPLGLSGYRLERLNAETGESTGRWDWPNLGGPQTNSHRFRNFIIGGFVRDEPVLITAQGTYGSMFFQAWKPDMSHRWEYSVDKDEPGARGSHMCPISDLDNDGIQELMWGERCIELDTGRELFCADRDAYRGHSDVVMPTLDRATGKWYLYTCRESDHSASPRVVMFDAEGERVWGAVDEGHIDMGWTARMGKDRRHIAMAIRIGHKSLGPKGLVHEGTQEFTFDALTGEETSLPFSTYRTVPVDVNGDGFHEVVCAAGNRLGQVIDRNGKVIAELGGAPVMASKFLDLPGEQVMCSYPDGKVRTWTDRNAEDCGEAEMRYSNPLYRVNQRLTATGSNLHALGGI